MRGLVEFGAREERRKGRSEAKRTWWFWRGRGGWEGGGRREIDQYE